MKQLLLLLLVTLSGPVFAQYSDEISTIEKLVRDVPNNDPKAFWMALKNHPQLNEAKKAISKKKKSMVETLNSMPDVSNVRNVVRKLAIYTEETRALIDRMDDITKLESTFPRIKMYVVPDNTPNARMALEGTCMINSYWLNPDVKTEELVGVCCHEAAHYLLMHQVRDLWKKIKAAKRNAFWAELGTGLAAGAYAYSQINAAQNGVAQSYQAQQQMYNNIAQAGVNAYNEGQWYAENRQKWLYMRQTETEADVVAFWFMEKNGIDPIHLINAFKKMEPYEPVLTKEQKKELDHPELSKRIRLLEKLYRKYHK